MKQEEYRSCMAAGLKNKPGLSKEERQREFCVQSQICSGKAKDQAEATTFCAESARNPKPLKSKKGLLGKDCQTKVKTLATCVLEKIDLKSENLGEALRGAISSCGCAGQKVETRERFIKKCFREHTVTGDIKEAQKLRSLCTAEWKAKHPQAVEA